MLKIQQSYVKFIRLNKCRPAKYGDLEGLNDFDEEENYPPFPKLEREILLRVFSETVERLTTSDEFAEYEMARERVLLFFFTWMEDLVPYREFLTFLAEKELPPPAPASFLREVERPFKAFFEELIGLGIATGEIAGRTFFQKQYPNLFWIEFRLLIQFWLKDKSEGFEQTDAAIEKGVNFTFDLVQPNALDSGFDLVKFMLGR